MSVYDMLNLLTVPSQQQQRVAFAANARPRVVRPFSGLQLQTCCSQLIRRLNNASSKSSTSCDAAYGPSPGYRPVQTPRRTTASMRCRPSSAVVKPHQALARPVQIVLHYALSFLRDVSGVSDQHRRACWCRPHTFRPPFHVVDRLHAATDAHKVR